MDRSNAGARINALRKAAGLSKEELARRVGVSDVAVHYWERGDSLPRGKNLLSLAVQLGTTPEHILSGKESKQLREPGAVYAAQKPQKIPWQQLGSPLQGAATVDLPEGHGMPGIPQGATATLHPCSPARPGRFVIALHRPSGQKAIYKTDTRGPHLFMLDPSGVYPPLPFDAQTWQIVAQITHIAFDI